jgi:hypothetical protein
MSDMDKEYKEKYKRITTEQIQERIKKSHGNTDDLQYELARRRREINGMHKEDAIYKRCGYTTEEFRKLSEESRIEIEQRVSLDELNDATKNATRLYERAGATENPNYYHRKYFKYRVTQYR